MIARSALSLALVALCVGCLLGAEAASKMRVRKSMWALTKREFKMYVRGVATMLTVSTKQGQRLYGPLYKDAEYFIVKHGVNANTPVKDLNPGLGPADAPNCYSPQDAPATRVLIVPGTCDVAHDGPWFMTFHTAFMLEFENSLLSVEPDLPGLPYWEMYEEFKGLPGRQGSYYGSPNGMLTPKNFGDIPGDPNNNYQVKEGIFRDRMIPAFTPAICKENGYPACDVYNGSRAGLLRQFDNNLTQPHIIRYPYTALTQVASRAYLAGGKEINFTRNDFARCSDPKIIKNMWNWVNCVDLYSIQVGGVDTQGWSLNNPLYTNGTNGFASVGTYHHALYHNMIGSFQPGTVGPTLPFGLLGDARTTSTSPNEIWLFYPFHNNLMRGFMIWQRNILAVDPKQADQDVLFGYPKNATNVPPIMRQGTGIDDIVSPRMPFTDLWPGISSKGITHRDMLSWKPNYRYDVMQF